MTPEEHDKELTKMERKVAALEKLNKRGKTLQKIGDYALAPLVIGGLFMFIDNRVSIVLHLFSISLYIVSIVGMWINIRAFRRI